MKRAVFAAAIAATALTFGASAHAQKTTEVHPGKAGSPHVLTEWTIDGANISIQYGRPSLKGRTVGQGLAVLKALLEKRGLCGRTMLPPLREFVGEV